jgi:hypothetical protein
LGEASCDQQERWVLPFPLKTVFCREQLMISLNIEVDSQATIRKIAYFMFLEIMLRVNVVDIFSYRWGFPPDK